MTNSPYAFEVEEGKLYAWCTCGYSQNQPLCDGSHRGKTEKKSLKWVAPKSGTVYFCGCKQTNSAPFCDGSHTKATK